MVVFMKKILIVDDFIEYRYEYKAMLEDLYLIEMAEDLDSAKQVIDEAINLAVIDINLDRYDRSNKDGILLASWIRTNFPNIKILLVSALFINESEIEPPFDSFLKKPMIESRLREEVKRLIEKKRE